MGVSVDFLQSNLAQSLLSRSRSTSTHTLNFTASQFARFMFNSLMAAMFLFMVSAPQAFASPVNTKIVTVQSCLKVGLVGSGIEVGDELSFYKIDPENPLSTPEKNLFETVVVRVNDQIKEGRFWGSITNLSDDDECRKWKDALYSETDTVRRQRDLFIARVSVSGFATSLQTTGFGILTSGLRQDFPFLYGYGFGLELFPMGSLGHDFVSQSLGFYGGWYQAQSPEDWNFDSGESLSATLTQISGGFLLRPFVIGPQSPSRLLIGYETYDLQHTVKVSGILGRSPLRSLNCGGINLGVGQELRIIDALSISLGFKASMGARCDSDEITIEEARRLQNSQRSITSTPLPLSEIVSNQKLESTSSYEGKIGLQIIPAQFFILAASAQARSFQAKLARNGTLFNFEIFQPSYQIDLIFSIR